MYPLAGLDKNQPYSLAMFHASIHLLQSDPPIIVKGNDRDCHPDD
jgi:hypothetical protein